MKRAAVLSALACLLAVTAAAPAASDAPAAVRGGATAAAGKASALDTVPRRGVLRVCTTGDYRPFSHRDPATGKYSGVDITMAA